MDSWYLSVFIECLSEEQAWGSRKRWRPARIALPPGRLLSGSYDNYLGERREAGRVWAQDGLGRLENGPSTGSCTALFTR